MYKEELSSPKKIDHTRITFDFLSERKVCLTMDHREGVKKTFNTVESPQRARFIDTQLKIGLQTKYEADEVSRLLEIHCKLTCLSIIENLVWLTQKSKP